MKIIKLKNHIVLCLTILMALLVGCENVECPLNNTVHAKFGFYTLSNKELTAIVVSDTLTVTAAGTDSVLLNKMYNTSQIELPMSYFGEEDTLSLAFTNVGGITTFDTIWVKKVNYEHFEAPACPVSMFHYVTGVRYTERLIDTVMIINPNVNYYDSENFKILFHSAD